MVDKEKESFLAIQRNFADLDYKGWHRNQCSEVLPPRSNHVLYVLSDLDKSICSS